MKECNTVMSEVKPKMTFDVRAHRLDSHGSKACIIKGIERVTPILKFSQRGVEVQLHGIRQGVPPQLESIDYVILVDTDESDIRLLFYTIMS